MSNKTNSNLYSVLNKEEQPNSTGSTESRIGLLNRPLSRRTAVASLLGTVAMIGAWRPAAASRQAQAACQPGPEFAAALRQSQLDYANQGLVIKPAKGIVATFGNSFYQLDAATNTYTLCRNGNVILRGKVRTETQDTRNVYIEEIEAVGATAGTKAIRLFHVVEVIDRSPLRAQVTLDAGFVGEASTFWFSTVYDVNARAFTRFMTKGTAPSFDLSPFRPLGRLIRNNFGSIILPPIASGPILPPEPDPPFDTRCFDCQVSAMVFCDLGTHSDAHNSICGRVVTECFDCLGGFPLLTFGF